MYLIKCEGRKYSITLKILRALFQAIFLGQHFALLCSVPHTVIFACFVQFFFVVVGVPGSAYSVDTVVTETVVIKSDIMFIILIDDGQ